MFDSNFGSSTLAMAVQVWNAFGFSNLTGFVIAAGLSVLVVAILFTLLTRH